MNRTQSIDFQGKKFFYIDFSYLKSIEEIKTVIQDAQKYIHAQPGMSVYTLTSVEETHFNSEIKDLFTAYMKSNKPYVKSSAIVGVTGLKLVMYNGMMKMTGRDTRAFSTLDQAKSWLAAQ
jgi:hypothetical protein